MVLKEAIAYYVNNGSSVYCTMLAFYVNNGTTVYFTMLDATKPFDRVEYCKLFRLLVSRDLPSAWLRLLLNIYTNSSTSIAWNGICSAMFLVEHGVKQSWAMSPILFCIYLDALLNLLATARIVCFIGRIFVGCLAYAHGRLAPTTGAMRNMLAICDSFAKDYNLVLNANKSKWSLFGNTGHWFNKVDFYVCGNIIEQEHEWPHLGPIVSDECNDASDILNRKHSLCGQINNVICYFSNRNSVVKQSLMTAYCCSLYGCELWDLSHPGVQNVCTAWKMG